MSSAWLAAIEQRLGASITERSAEKLSLSEIRTLTQDLVAFHNANRLPSRLQHQLRPRIDGDGAWRAAGGLRTSAPKPLRAMLKSLLLLADSVALQDPIVDAWLTQKFIESEASRLTHLRKSIREVARLADLVRSNVVVVYSPTNKLISANSGYSIDHPSVLGDVSVVDETELSSELRTIYSNRSLQFDWDAAWLAHALTTGSATPFARSLKLVQPKGTTDPSSRSLLFCGDNELVERVMGLLWEHRVREYYDGMCDPGPMSPATADLFCSLLRLLRTIVTSRDERVPVDYFFLLSNPYVQADRIDAAEISAIRANSTEFSAFRKLIQESLDYAYHVDTTYVHRHMEFMRSIQSQIDALKSEIAAGRRGRLLSHTIEVGDAFTVGGAAGLAQYMLQADLAQSLVAAPAGALAAIVVRILKTLCLGERRAVQAHFVAFGPPKAAKQ